MINSEMLMGSIILENIRYIENQGTEGLSAFSKVAQEAYQLNSEMPEVFKRIVQEFKKKNMRFRITLMF